MLRLSPVNKERLADTKQFDACYGGSESNVMIALSLFGNNTEFITVLPTNDLGTAVERHLHRFQVGTKYVVKRGDVLGSYYIEEGFGLLGSKVIYNRSGSEIAKSNENLELDYNAIFSDCDLFHISGISFALSEGCQRLCFKLLEEAKSRQIPVSLDFNYRGKLWTKEEAAKVYKKILSYVDILFCADQDFEDFLGIKPDDFYKHYDCKYLIRRNRKVLAAAEQEVSVILNYKNGDEIITVDSFCGPYDVLDRVGTGDAFCAGVLHSILNDFSGVPSKDDLQKAVDLGIKCFVLKHCQRGDILTLSLEDIKAHDELKVEDVKR